MVVRAYCKNKDGNSKVITHTYFVTTNNLSKYQDFTIISLVANPEDLFDPENGLYVVGNGYIEAKKNWIKILILGAVVVLEICSN